MAIGDSIPEIFGGIVVAAFVYGELETVAPVAGATATAIMTRYLNSRHEKARSILRSEWERSGIIAADFKDGEQLAAAAWRYRRAARDQAADENLHILAQAMIGLGRRHNLFASDFLKYAEMLAPLSRLQRPATPESYD